MQTNAKTARPGAEKKRPDRTPKKQAPARKAGPQTAQQTIPYREIFKDGICRVNDRLYTKSMEYEDINYQLAQADDQSAIFDGYCAFLNSFDSSLPFQLSFINHRSRPESKYKLNIPMKEDGYSDMRSEYVEMLEGQIAKSNNGIVRTKLLTFGVSADSLAVARPRLERVEADISSNFKKLGVQSRPLNGVERLEILHGQLHPGGTEPFRFTWDMIPKTGMGTKDFIAPISFDFRQTRLFRMGSTWGAASYMQIMASELSDKLLAELLEVDAEMTITMHIQTVDQAKAIKTIKGKVSDIDKMKVEEQKKAVRSGYDMDILPPDLVTFSQDAKNLLNDLQSRNERMFLLTFLVVNTAATRRELDNDLFTVSGMPRPGLSLRSTRPANIAKSFLRSMRQTLNFTGRPAPTSKPFSAEPSSLRWTRSKRKAASSRSRKRSSTPSTAKPKWICRRLRPSRPTLTICWATRSRAERRNRSVRDCDA